MTTANPFASVPFASNPHITFSIDWADIDSWQYATAYVNDRAVASFSRRRVTDRRDPAAWRMYNTDGVEVFAATVPCVPFGRVGRAAVANLLACRT